MRSIAVLIDLPPSRKSERRLPLPRTQPLLPILASSTHADGYNLLPAWSGETDRSPRQEFFYWTDDGDLAALRYNNWKIHFMEQRGEGLDVWQEPFVSLRFPKLMNLRADPFEDADVPCTCAGSSRMLWPGSSPSSG